MAISASIIDGKVYANTTADSLSKDYTGSSSIGKDQFLQILVAEMKYQDPLEPTTNTEWISQMATFSQIEELQNMSGTLENGQAQELVGKIVIVSSTDSMGETSYISGKVECIEIRDDGTYLSIGENLYKLENLYSVVDEDYYEQLIQEAEKKKS